jgi:hypothetical protein
MKYTDDELLTALQTLADEQGGSPTAREANAHPDCPSAPTFAQRFGSWNEALRAAGLTPRPREYSDDELLTMLQSLATEHGRSPTAEEVTAHPDYPTVSTFKRRFGSWNTALHEAGLDQHLPRLSDEELLTALQNLSDELGKRPSAIEVNGCDDMASVQTYMNRFGSWNAALAAANLCSNQYSTNQ